MIPFTAHSAYNVLCSGSQFANITRSLAMCVVVAHAISGTYYL